MTLSRRDFLYDVGQFLPAAALASLPPLTRGAAAAELRVATAAGSSPSETVRLALIGTGGRGGYLMNLLLDRPHAVLTTVCDVNELNRARAAEHAGGRQNRPVAQADDFRRVLDDDTIDAVVVATPHHWHGPIAIRALQAGKHVYLEKPASHVFREGRLLAEAADKAPRVLQHGTQMRSSQVTAAAAEVLASGVLGEIKQAKAWGVEPRSNHPQTVPDEPPPEHLDWNTWLGPAPERPYNRLRHSRWNSYRDYGNGEIGGDGIHDIDLARWGLGVETHPVKIMAQGSRVQLTGESDFPDNMLVTFEYADGRTLVYENRNFAPYKLHGWDNGNVFYGTKGYMVFSRRGYFQTFLGGDEEQGPGLRGGAGNEDHVQNFLDAVRGNAAANTNALTAHLSCALVHLGEAAYRSGRVLHFDPKVEEFILAEGGVDKMANDRLTKQYRSTWGLANGDRG